MVSPVPTVEIDAPQHLQRAVAGFDAARFEPCGWREARIRRHARLPETPRSPAARATASASLPSKISLPALSTMTRSVICSMKPIRCSTTMIAMPVRASSFSLPATHSSSAGFRPAASSSNEKQPRPGRQRTGEIEHLLLRAVQFGGAAVGDLGEPAVDSSSALGIGGARGCTAISDRDLDVLAHGQRQERLRHLECAVDAEMHELVRRPCRRSSLPSKRHLPPSAG